MTEDLTIPLFDDKAYNKLLSDMQAHMVEISDLAFTYLEKLSEAAWTEGDEALASVASEVADNPAEFKDFLKKFYAQVLRRM